MGGLFDGFGNEIKKQFIARPDSAKSHVVYKWPETNIPMFSLCTVQPDEWALFVKEGQVVGYLPTGQHKLDGAQIPFLDGLIDKFTGGNALMSELYFVSSREFPNNKFGGKLQEQIDVKVEAPDVLPNPVTFKTDIRYNGEMTFKVSDPIKLIMKLYGTFQRFDDEIILQTLKTQLPQATKPVVEKLLATPGWTIFDIIAEKDVETVTAAILNIVNRDSDLSPEQGGGMLGVGQYGLQVTKLQQFDFNIDDTAKANIQKQYDIINELRLAQSPAAMQAAQIAAMRGAGEGMAKGGEGSAMAGMFFGANMGQNIAGASNTQSTPQVVVLCPKCGAKNPEHAKFCGECGTPMVPQGVKCGKCGFENAPGSKFCGECGNKL